MTARGLGSALRFQKVDALEAMGLGMVMFLHIVATQAKGPNCGSTRNDWKRGSQTYG